MFLDQISRNFVWARCSSTDCASLRQACNVVALPLALSVLANVGESNLGKGFLAMASPVECCFLSLVLRHTCLPVFSWCRRENPESSFNNAHCHLVLAILLTPEMAILLCERFLSKMRDVVDAIPVENYLRHALTGDQPLLFEGLASVPPRRCRVLDLSKVDTMVTCYLLWFLRHLLRPIDRFQWCALHLCYPNSADALDVESSTLQIRRSHDVLRTSFHVYVMTNS